jgi:hypothetical protein
MSQFVNVACPVSFNGRHYPGFTLYDGVSITGFQPATCGINRTQIMFSGSGVKPYAVFLEGITGADLSTIPCHEYLQMTKI